MWWRLSVSRGVLVLERRMNEKTFELEYENVQNKKFSLASSRFQVTPYKGGHNFHDHEVQGVYCCAWAVN